MVVYPCSQIRGQQKPPRRNRGGYTQKPTRRKDGEKVRKQWKANSKIWVQRPLYCKTPLKSTAKRPKTGKQAPHIRPCCGRGKRTTPTPPRESPKACTGWAWQLPKVFFANVRTRSGPRPRTGPRLATAETPICGTCNPHCIGMFSGWMFCGGVWIWRPIYPMIWTGTP